jgi:hypothetical protein
METDRCPFLQKQLDRISQNDPYATDFDSLIRGDDDVLALGSALQKSTHVTRLCFKASMLTSIHGFSTMEEYLKSTKSLQQLIFLPPNNTATFNGKKLMKKITDRLFSALQENTYSPRELELQATDFSYPALSQYVSVSTSLQVLRLTGGAENCNCSDRDAQTVSKAINQCHKLKEIDLNKPSQSLMVSILQDGIKNHPTLQKLSMRQVRSQNFTAAVAVALRNVLNSSTPLRSLQFYDCYNLPRQVMEGLWRHATVESLHLENCGFSDDDAIEAFEAMKLNHPMRSSNPLF